MSDEFWLADTEARVLGPVSATVIATLKARGKLPEVRAASRDGRKFVPLREMPELQAIIQGPVSSNEAQRAQGDIVQQIRDWLRSIQSLPSHDIFKVPSSASKEAWRAAFFALVQRYVPSRLPPDTTAELRLACEDAFLALSERMVEVERQFRAMAQAVPTPPPTVAPPSTAHLVRRRDVIQITLSLKRGDAVPFTRDVEHNWQTDCLFIASAERLTPGTAVEMVVIFEGHVTQLHASGRIMAARVGGFTVKMLNLVESQRALIRTWVARVS